jgi:hypothetical protein
VRFVIRSRLFSDAERDNLMPVVSPL